MQNSCRRRPPVCQRRAGTVGVQLQHCVVCLVEMGRFQIIKTDEISNAIYSQNIAISTAIQYFATRTILETERTADWQNKLLS